MHKIRCMYECMNNYSKHKASGQNTCIQLRTGLYINVWYRLNPPEAKRAVSIDEIRSAALLIELVYGWWVELLEL